MKKSQKQLAPHRQHLDVVRQQLDVVDRMLEGDDVASVAAKYAMDLSDDLRFEHGVKAGLARARTATRKRT